MFISLFRIHGLGLSHFIAEIFVEGSEIFGEFLQDCWGWQGEFWMRLDQVPRVFPIHSVDWSDPCTGRQGVVVREFSYGEEFRPITLLIVTVPTKVLFYKGINSFCLAICL